MHELKNTGEKRIVTDFYNHNFFNVDGDPVGPNYSFAFPCEVKAQDLKGKFGDLVELKDKELRFKDKIPNGVDRDGDTDRLRREGREAPRGSRCATRRAVSR